MAADQAAPTPAGDTETCPQAWPGGLTENIVAITGGILTECVRPPRHTGKHRDADRSMSWWGGKLSPEEAAAADALRAAGRIG